MNDAKAPTGGQDAQETHKSFVIHLWFETGRHWRGRIRDDKGHRAFEDGQSLLGFIQNRLHEESDVTLPARQSWP